MRRRACLARVASSSRATLRLFLAARAARSRSAMHAAFAPSNDELGEQFRFGRSSDSSKGQSFPSKIALATARRDGASGGFPR